MKRVVAALLLGSLCAGAQEQTPTFRTETTLALIGFHVIQKNRYAEDVRLEDIQLLEDGKPQKVALFEGPGVSSRRTIPLEVIMLFDVSLSVMDENLLDSFAIKETILDGLGGNVGVSIYAFGGKFKRFTPPTNDAARLKQALDAVYKFTNPGTPLYESIIKAAKDAYDTTGPQVSRAMLILSDGEATTKMKPEAAVAAASQYGVRLYPVVLGHERARKMAAYGGNPGVGGSGGMGRGNMPGNPAQERRNERLRDKEYQMLEFASIGAPTGGRSFDPQTINTTMIRAILSALVWSVRSEYLVGYSPAGSGETKGVHKVEVRLINKSKGKLSGGSRTVVH